MSNTKKQKEKKAFIYSFGQKLLFPFFKLFYFVKIKKKALLPEGKYIICANHSSMKDPVLLSFTQKRQIFFMGKSEFFENKFLAKLFSALGCFPVQRGKNDQKSISHAEELLNNNRVLGIFIEGTRSKDAKLLPPKNGVAMLSYKTSSPVVPVSISQKFGKPMTIFHKITVNVGAPIYPEELGITEGRAKEFRNASRMIMQHIKDLRREDVIVSEEGS